MKKTCKILGAFAMLMLAGGVAFSACGDDTSSASNSSSNNEDASTVKLVDFRDESVAVLLGDEYRLANTVKDESGNEYALNYTIKTQSGNAVGTINGKFWVDYFENYSITYSVAISETDVRTRTVTLSVEDKGIPDITFGEFEYGKAGEEYALPSVSIFDASGEAIEPTLKLYKLNGEEKVGEVEVTDGKFTPDEGGYYLYESTAVDSSGNTAQESVILYMQSKVKSTDIFVLDEAEYADRLDLGTNKTCTWLAEYAGEHGVAQISYMGQQWEPQFKFAPMQDVSSDSSALLTAYESVIVRMYIEQSAEVTNCWQYVTMRNGAGKDSKVAEVEYNRWVDYQFPISALTDAQEYAAKVYGKSAQLHEEDGVTAKNHKGVFYVSDVFVANEATISLTGDLKPLSTITVNAKAGDTALDLTNADISVITPEGQTLKGKNGQFIPKSRGVYTVYVKADGYWGKLTFSVTGVDRSDELISFNYEGDLSYVDNSTAREETWVSSFAGEQGVFRTEYFTSGNWNMQFTFTSLQDISANSSIYSEYKYVVLKMYIVQDETYQSSWEYVFINTSSAAYRSSTAVQTNTWVEYKFDISLLNYLGNGKIKFGGREVSAPTDGSEQKGCFYVADISLSK